MGKTKKSSRKVEPAAAAASTAAEIDEIFSKMKKSNKVERKSSLPEPTANGDTQDSLHMTSTDDIEAEMDKNQKKKKRKDDSSDRKEKKKKSKNKREWPDPPSRSRRRTNDGYAVYSAEEIGFNKNDSGGTPLCPFDCDCCF